MTFDLIIDRALTSAILALVALVVGRFFARSPGVRHALWAAAALALIVPPIFELPLISVPGETTFPTFEQQQLVDLPANVQALDGLATEAQQPLKSAHNDSSPEHPFGIFLVIWVLGITVSLSFLAVNYMKLRRWAGSLESAPTNLRAHVRRVARAMGQKTPKILVGEAASPCVLGILSPRLVLTTKLEAFDPVIAHELKHVARRDNLIALVAMLARIIWWWYPLSWFIERRLQDEAELACDLAAVAHFPHERQGLAAAIIEAASGEGPRPHAALSQRRALVRRLQAIMHPQRAGKGAHHFAWVFVATAFVGFGQGEVGDLQREPEAWHRSVALSLPQSMTSLAIDWPKGQVIVLSTKGKKLTVSLVGEKNKEFVFSAKVKKDGSQGKLIIDAPKHRSKSLVVRLPRPLDLSIQGNSVVVKAKSSHLAIQANANVVVKSPQASMEFLAISTAKGPVVIDVAHVRRQLAVQAGTGPVVFTARGKIAPRQIAIANRNGPFVVRTSRTCRRTIRTETQMALAKGKPRYVDLR